MAKTLRREDILNALDMPMDTVHVPRWGGDVLVRAMPVGHPRYRLYVDGGAGKGRKAPETAAEEFARRMVGTVIMSALDPDTETPMFTWDDADALRERHWNSVIKVATKALELAGGDDDDEEEGPEAPETDDAGIHLVADEADETTEGDDSPQEAPTAAPLAD